MAHTLMAAVIFVVERAQVEAVRICRKRFAYRFVIGYQHRGAREYGGISAGEVGGVVAIVYVGLSRGRIEEECPFVLADHSNIKRFMATGLTVSFIANLCVGLLGLFSGGGTLATTTLFVVFAVLWGINGWSQSMGAAPAIIALSRWYPLKKRGTYYGFFSASHNLGEAISFVFVGLVVGLAGWKWGFVGSAIAGAMGVAVILLFLHDTDRKSTRLNSSHT